MSGGEGRQSVVDVKKSVVSLDVESVLGEFDVAMATVTALTAPRKGSINNNAITTFTR